MSWKGKIASKALQGAAIGTIVGGVIKLGSLGKESAAGYKGLCDFLTHNDTCKYCVGSCSPEGYFVDVVCPDNFGVERPFSVSSLISNDNKWKYFRNVINFDCISGAINANDTARNEFTDGTPDILVFTALGLVVGGMVGVAEVVLDACQLDNTQSYSTNLFNWWNKSSRQNVNPTQDAAVNSELRQKRA
ncbi:MAG: hypothetical protein SFW66_09225 [Gammaproteobacteria bacterium]|nr:hypothetical protein [Gammaproteobacteria bacterium]